MRTLVFASLFIALFSCKEITFKEPQPRGKKALKEIPKTLVGTYLLKNEKDGETDTLFVNSKGYVIASDKKGGDLGDSLVLKKFQGYYFININENPEWLLRVIKQDNNGDLVYMTMEEDEGLSFKEFLIKVSKEIEVDSVEINGEKLYQIDPSPKQLVRLIEKGYFKKTVEMTKLK
ncbi:MAG TPA: hypothetical protein VF141_22820 [Chryseolinea sp.]